MPFAETVVLLNGVSANGNSANQDTNGFLSAQQIEIVESNGGTATLTIQGTFDGTNFYSCGYQLVDNTASPARAVAGIAVTANSRHVYQVLDPYPYLRINVASVASSPVLTVKLYAV